MKLSQGGPQIMSEKVKDIVAKKIDDTLQSHHPYESRPDLIMNKNIKNTTAKHFRKRQMESRERVI